MLPTHRTRTARRLCGLVCCRAMTPPEIFKAYDIRGTYPDQIDRDTAYQIGRASRAC